MPAPSENREMIEGRDARFWHKADLFRAGENFRFFELPWSMEECRKVGTAYGQVRRERRSKACKPTW